MLLVLPLAMHLLSLSMPSLAAPRAAAWAAADALVQLQPEVHSEVHQMHRRVLRPSWTSQQPQSPSECFRCKRAIGTHHEPSDSKHSHSARKWGMVQASRAEGPFASSTNGSEGRGSQIDAK